MGYGWVAGWLVYLLFIRQKSIHNKQWVRSIPISQLKSIWVHWKQMANVCRCVCAAYHHLFVYRAIVLQAACEWKWKRGTQILAHAKHGSVVRSAFLWLLPLLYCDYVALHFVYSRWQCVARTLINNIWGLLFIIDAQFISPQHQFEVLLQKILLSLTHWFHCLTLSKYPSRVDKLLM